MTVDKLTGIESGIEIAKKINEIIDDKAEMNSDTTGNAATASKLKDARQISLTGDIVGSAYFDGSENKSITTELQNTTKIDGQWVSKVQTLSTATAVGTYEIDLSDYLPDDNYNYEVLFSIRGCNSSETTALSLLYSKIWDDQSAFSVGHLEVSKGADQIQNIVSIPIKERKVYLKNYHHSYISGTFSLKAIGFRRIGTNS